MSETLDKLRGNFHVHEILCQRRIGRPLVTILKVEMSAFVLKDDSHGNETLELIYSIIKFQQVFIIGNFPIRPAHIGQLRDQFFEVCHTTERSQEPLD